MVFKVNGIFGERYNNLSENNEGLCTNPLGFTSVSVCIATTLRICDFGFAIVLWRTLAMRLRNVKVALSWRIAFSTNSYTQSLTVSYYYCNTIRVHCNIHYTTIKYFPVIDNDTSFSLLRNIRRTSTVNRSICSSESILSLIDALNHSTCVQRLGNVNVTTTLRKR